MAGGIVGAVVIVAGGAVALRPWERGEKPPNVATDNPSERIRHVLDQPTFAAALAYARPVVVDYDYGNGQFLLTVWAIPHLRWADIEVGAPETSFPLVKKDPDAERGKRLCENVRVLDIRAEVFAQGRKAFQGLAISRGPDPVVPYQFTAVGSTGEIVAHTNATFCGVATGLFSYQSADGTRREGLQVLGMFDLPENRTH